MYSRTLALPIKSEDLGPDEDENLPKIDRSCLQELENVREYSDRQG